VRNGSKTALLKSVGAMGPSPLTELLRQVKAGDKASSTTWFDGLQRIAAEADSYLSRERSDQLGSQRRCS